MTRTCSGSPSCCLSSLAAHALPLRRRRPRSTSTSMPRASPHFTNMPEPGKQLEAHDLFEGRTSRVYQDPREPARPLSRSLPAATTAYIAGGRPPVPAARGVLARRDARRERLRPERGLGGRRHGADAADALHGRHAWASPTRSTRARTSSAARAFCASWPTSGRATWCCTVASYNAGSGAVERYNGVPPYSETRRYVNRVLTHYYAFRSGQLP